MAKRKSKAETESKARDTKKSKSTTSSSTRLPAIPPRSDSEGPSLPSQLPLLPLQGEVVFPQTVVPLIVGRPTGIKLVEELFGSGEDALIGLVTQRNPEDESPDLDGLYPDLCVATILKMLKFPDGSTRIVVQGVNRARLIGIASDRPYLTGLIEPLKEQVEAGEELDALEHLINSLFGRMSDQVPEELQIAAMNVHDPARLADLLASSLPFSVEEKQSMLAEGDVKARLMELGRLLTRQLNVMELSTKIQAQVGSEITRAQREHFLRQQIKAIQEELGESDSATADARSLEKQVRRAKMSPEARAEARREIDRLASMPPSSAEYSIIRTYIDWLTSLPWAKLSEDHLDLTRAREILDEDHFNLEKVKDRILEYLAVCKLKQEMKGPILCFVGPPGTGKTSLGRSIARAMGREFARISLGGIHDEAEIRGHRRTYVAAMPGRIIQALRKVGTKNPVMILDEVDKLGRDFRGDPGSALLEVLDPEQNDTFRDNYLDVDFDLSKVMFIATANILDPIPGPLVDRLEILELPGYSEEEKIEITARHLLPKQLKDHGITEKDVKIQPDAVQRVIADYTREAGLRQLERELAAICRKVARRRAEGGTKQIKVEASNLDEFLGPPKHFREVAARQGLPGVATGLAWTPTGGEILFIEVSGNPGKGNLTLTGLLGDSMKESAQAALSYIKTNAKNLGIGSFDFGKTDLHVHVPAGAIPKDGPSAGIAIAAAMMSHFRHEPVRQDLAMTGELTLTGRILPVGGIKEKVLGARRAGIKHVMIPTHNRKDLADLTTEVRDSIAFQAVETLDDIIPALFSSSPTTKKTKSKGPTTGSSRGTRRSRGPQPGLEASASKTRLR